MNKISKIEVKKISSLSKIKISEEDTKKYTSELSSVLGYIEKLNEVDTEGIEEISQITKLKNIYRDDKVVNEWKISKNIVENSQKLLRNAKNKKNGYIKVKQMLG